MSPLQLIFSMAFLLAITGISMHRTHLLSALLCLEAMMLSLFIALAMWSLYQNTPLFYSAPMILLTFSACEASTGLALLVATTRTHATNQLASLNILQC